MLLRVVKTFLWNDIVFLWIRRYMPDCFHTIPQQVRFLTKIYHPNIDKVCIPSFHSLASNVFLPLFASLMKHLCSLEGYALIFSRTNGVLLFKLELCFWGNATYYSDNRLGENVNLFIFLLLVLAFKHFWALPIPMTHSLKTLPSIGNQTRLKLLKRVCLK